MRSLVPASAGRLAEGAALVGFDQDLKAEAARTSNRSAACSPGFSDRPQVGAQPKADRRGTRRTRGADRRKSSGAWIQCGHAFRGGNRLLTRSVYLSAFAVLHNPPAATKAGAGSAEKLTPEPSLPDPPVDQRALCKAQ